MTHNFRQEAFGEELKSVLLISCLFGLISIGGGGEGTRVYGLKPAFPGLCSALWPICCSALLDN